MRALDSNVLLRYLLADDPRPTAAADNVIEKCRRSEEPIFIPALVLCETIWVLEKAYRHSRKQICEAIGALLVVDLLRFEHDRSVRLAFERYREARAGFADYLMGEISSAAGCRDTVTFDRALKGSPGFTLL